MKKRGVTLIELLVGMSLMAFVMLGVCSMFITGMLNTEKRQKDATLSEDAVQGVRYLTERLRNAMAITIGTGGRSITYTLPRRSSSDDAITGEKELLYPIVSDGVSRSFSINTRKQLIDSDGSRVLVRDVATVDPETTSSQYNLSYPVFQLTTVGSRRAVTITLIAKADVNGDPRFVRMKTTVLLRNAL